VCDTPLILQIQQVRAGNRMFLFGSSYIETERLLLGIIREDTVLTNRFLGSQAETIRKEVESHTTVRR
jgi:hypothetical protein